ncbi:MAG: YihA family ribosome biogenesis GTP-binding protein [Acidobacteria bacterium]|nr:YihA family ribosome biogenesis GTP-binding protein [Acidobacteriota bacterium]
MHQIPARFIISAAQPEQFPREDLPEFAFLGRSNVGKSTLLNSLVGHKALAHTSSTPGRTQTINFFRIHDRWQFVDLPGYGYARVPGEISRLWKSLIESYLNERQSLVLCFLLLDSRRGWMPPDLELKSWLEAQNLNYLVIATKFDKLKTQKERHAAMAGLHRHCDPSRIVPFSAVTGQGARNIWQTISKTPKP